MERGQAIRPRRPPTFDPGSPGCNGAPPGVRSTAQTKETWGEFGMSCRPHGRGAAAMAATVLAFACPAGARAAGVHAVATIRPVGAGTTSPSQIATGDFDGNGIIDLVASGAATAGGDVSILPGRGN